MRTRGGGGALGPGPRPLEGEGTRREPAPNPDPGREPEARPGRPLPDGANRTRRWPGRGPRRAPRGSSPPRCHVPPALRLRDEPAPYSGSAGPGHIGLARGRPAPDRTERGAEPAGRAQTPLKARGARRLYSRPPSPVRSSSFSSSSPALPRRLLHDVTPTRRPPLLPASILC